MNYNFPVIYSIDDVLPIIKDRKEFIVAEREWYDVINYVVSTHETFNGSELVTREDAILRECRGLIFSKNGVILSRPLHKFFNVGEKEETRMERIDLGKKHAILEKLDGSMVRPIYNSETKTFHIATKMGITDVALEAQKFVNKNPQYLTFFEHCRVLRFSPTFEWISPHNRIVIAYEKSDLVLTALRNLYSGQYLDIHNVPEHFIKGIPVVKQYEETKDIKELLEKTKNLEGMEGYVLRFENGHMAKIKSDSYLALHRSKEIVQNERIVVSLILQDKLDDVLPVLILQEDKDRAAELQTNVSASLLDYTEKLISAFDEYKKSGMTRRDFALESKLPGLFKKGVFFLMDGGDPMVYIRQIFLSNTGQETKYEKFKKDQNLEW